MAVNLGSGQTATGPLNMTFPAPKKQPPVSRPMSAQWDAVYGQGSYVATVLGTGQDAQGILTGGAGLSIKVEVHYAAGSDAGELKGVAEDNRGNLYKIAF